MCVCFDSARRQTRQERAAVRGRDPRPVPEVQRDLPVATHTAGARGAVENMR